MAEPTQTMLGPGAVVAGRFEIAAIAGSGGMGVVYRALDRETGGVVALKILEREGESERARFEREAQLLRVIHHEGVVRYVWHGSDGSRSILAMEWLEGEDLEQILRARGALGLDRTLALGERVALALAAAHAAGLIHRDLKPGNVFLARDGSVRVLDFGLARPLSEDTRITATGWVVGTPGFMAPEQIRGTGFDARTDLFALGAVLFEALTGRPAFPGKNAAEMLTAVLTRDPPVLRPDEAPAPLAALIASMLSRDPSGRPSSAAEVAHTLGELRAGGAAPTARPSSRRLARTEHRVLPVPRWFAWGVLVDTNRWNRLAGSPHTQYRLETLEGVVERVGEGELFGSAVRWVERGEWWEGTAGRGERHFLGGPFKMIRFAFRTADAPGGGTDATVELLVEPAAGTADDIAAALLEHLGARLVRYLDAIAAFAGEGRFAPAAEPLPMSQRAQRALLAQPRNRVLCGRPPTVDAARVTERSAQLRARVAAPLADRVLEVVTAFPDELAARLRPYELADVWGLDRRAVLLAFLEATRAGLLELRWDVLCTVCRAPILPGVTAPARGKAHCAFCRLDFDVDLAENLEGVFTPAPALREGQTGVYCGGSPTFRPAVFGHLALQPHEVRASLQEPIPGPWSARLARPAGASSEAITDGRPRDLQVCDGVVLAAPSADWRVENATAAPREISLERVVPTADSVLGMEMLGLPEYADLLLTDAAARGLDLRTGRAVILHVELVGLDDVDDAHLLGWVLRERARWAELARDRRGALHHVDHATGTLGFPTVTAAAGFFIDATRALRAAPPIPGGSAAMVGGVAEGPALFLGSGGAVEPFGAATRAARRLVRRALSGTLVFASTLDEAARAGRDEGVRVVSLAEDVSALQP